MKIQFTKMQGLGNDFMVVNGVTQSFHPTKDSIRRLSDRRFGIGFDQLLILEPPTQPDVDFFYRIYNSDGSESAQCGNGARCLARFILDQGFMNKTQFKVATRADVLTLNIVDDGTVSVNMGLPRWEPKEIPFEAAQKEKLYTLKTSQGNITVGLMSLGNPHCVIQVPEVDTAPVETLGAEIAKSPLFPESVNVGFMQIVNENHIKVRVFERGAGETFACGSGACAAVCIGRKQKLLSEHVQVDLKGGSLIVCWTGDNEPVWMRGPAVTVYEGVVECD